MILQELRHPNVLQFLGAVMRPPDLCMVTEHLPFSLHGVMYQTPGVDLDKRRVMAMAQDIARCGVCVWGGEERRGGGRWGEGPQGARWWGRYKGRGA